MSDAKRPAKAKIDAETRTPKRRKKKITFADKLVQWRVEMQRMAELLMEDDEFVRAQSLVSAAVIIKTLHESMCQDNYDEEEWSNFDG